MKCPSCGAAKLVRETRDIEYVYKGETTTIPAVRGEFCPACGESVLAAAESSRVSAAMLALNKQVNASIVDPGGECQGKAPKAISIRLPLTDLESAQRIAAKEGIGYQTVLKRAISEGLKKVS